ncbi:MAG: murein biosynthesis integral membrane protein MurJ [Planctomycetota bacterium]|nr:murein biosynthesis integral membrane protein MurJ [Planctomycetota bacterium]
MALIGRAAVVGGWTLGSRLLGLVRDRFLAGAFGGSLVLDAFLLAFALPNLFRNLFGEGALSAAFLPRYVQQRDTDPSAADAFAGLVLGRLALLLAAIAGVGMAVAGSLSLYGVPKLALVAALTLPQLPYLVFICCCAIMAGTLNGRRHFAIPAAAPVLLNLILIAAIVWWQDIWILPYAVLVTGLVQTAAHLLALWRTGGVPRVRLRSTPALRELRTALLPVLLASSVYQINALLDSVLAFVLVSGSGAVAFLYFANRLFQFPLALIGHGVGTAIYPELASAASKGWDASGRALHQAGGVLGAALLPAAVGLFLVAEPLAGTVYMSQDFDQAAVDRTALAAQMFAFGLLPIAFAKLFLRACHAHRDQRTPLRIGIATVVGNLVLNLILVQTPLQEAGLALASSISAWGSAVAYALTLRRRGSGRIVPWRGLLWPAVASAVMGCAVWALLTWWPGTGVGFAWHAPRLATAVIGGGIVYAALAGVPLLRRLRRLRRLKSS